MPCKYCISRGKTWNGDNPRCAFEQFRFSNNNWNCAAMNILRDLAEEHGFFYKLNDESIGVVPLECGYIILTWYKDRGCTGNAIFMVDDEQPRKINIDDVEDAINFYNKT